MEAGAAGWKLVATARHNFAGQTFFALIGREFLFMKKNDYFFTCISELTPFLSVSNTIKYLQPIDVHSILVQLHLMCTKLIFYS